MTEGASCGLTPASARACAELALAGVAREWPHHYVLLANGPRDLRRPRVLHPAFYGCYDWHSAVHSHWTLARLRRLFPDLPSAGRITSRLDRHLNPRTVAAEVRFFQAPGRAGFERPYGWGWLLALAAELGRGGDAPSRRWAAALAPLERLVVRRFCEWLPRLRQPVRSGLHANTAFGMTLAWDYAAAAGRERLRRILADRAVEFFGGDRSNAGLEPGGSDFLSPTLAEADLMRRVLPGGEFKTWLRRFLPRLPPNLRTPADPGRWRDGQSIHLDGLNLSRAWALRGLAAAGGPNRPGLLRAAEAHSRAGLSRVASGDYLGEHWLATFAVLLLTEASPAQGRASADT